MEIVSLQKCFKLLSIFLLNVNLENLTIGLHIFITSSILAKFQVDQRSIAMLSIKCLNFKFLWSKFIHKK